MMKSLFYPIDSQNLFYVFSHACICPSCLYEERQDDVQTVNKTYILLTESKEIPAKADISIEVKVYDEEKASMIKNGKHFLYRGLIPLSRVIGISYIDRQNINKTRIQIEANTAYFPSRLIAKRADKNLSTGEDIVTIAPNEKISDVSTLKLRYDKWLGGMALGSITGIRNKSINPDFLMYLAFFIPNIKELMESNDMEFKSPVENADYKAVLDYIRDSRIINKDTVRAAAAASGQEIPKIGIIKKEDFSGLIGAPYLLYILYNFKTYDLDNDGNGTDKIDTLISKRFDNVKEKELSAFCYGCHRGYKIFRKAYADIPCKFQLDNYLDYAIIESVYKLVCKDHVDSKYYTDLLNEVTIGINKPSDFANKDMFSVYGYEVRKVEDIPYPSAKWFCRFLSQQRTEKEIMQEFDRLVAYFNKEKTAVQPDNPETTKLKSSLREAEEKIQMLTEGVNNDERIIEDKDAQLKNYQSEIEQLRIDNDSLKREQLSKESGEPDDIPANICESNLSECEDVQALKSIISKLEEKNFQFSKRLAEFEKHENKTFTDSYLNLGLGSTDNEAVNAVESIVNRTIELSKDQSAVLIGKLKENGLYASSCSKKEAMISRLILLEKGLIND